MYVRPTAWEKGPKFALLALFTHSGSNCFEPHPGPYLPSLTISWSPSGPRARLLHHNWSRPLPSLFSSIYPEARSRYIATTEEGEFDSLQDYEVFFFFLFRASRRNLGPIQWVPGAISPEVNRPGGEFCYSPSLYAEIKNAWGLHLHSPMSLPWRGA